MINYSLLEDLSKKIHQIMGSSSSFEKKSGGLDLIEVMKQSELKIQNTGVTIVFLNHYYFQC
jgi:hypothetical protein